MCVPRRETPISSISVSRVAVSCVVGAATLVSATQEAPPLIPAFLRRKSVDLHTDEDDLEPAANLIVWIRLDTQAPLSRSDQPLLAGMDLLLPLSLWAFGRPSSCRR